MTPFQNQLLKNKKKLEDNKPVRKKPTKYVKWTDVLKREIQNLKIGRE